MSKVFSEGLLGELKTEFRSELIERNKEFLLQVLHFLEIIKDEKMARISQELTQILDDDENLKMITNAQDLDELLKILMQICDEKMLKIYESAYLAERFPILSRQKFIS